MCTHGCLTFAEFWFTSCLMLHPSHTHSHFYPLLSVTSGSLCCSCRSLFTPCIPNLLLGWLHSVGPSVPPHSQTHTLALFHIHMHVHYTHTHRPAACFVVPARGRLLHLSLSNLNPLAQQQLAPISSPMGLDFIKDTVMYAAACSGLISSTQSTGYSPKQGNVIK